MDAVKNLVSNGIRTGGGIYIDSGNATLKNCIISNNSISGSSNAKGGGVAMSGTLTLNNCAIRNNSISGSVGSFSSSSALGGGVYLEGSCTLYNCIIDGNSGETSAGNFSTAISRGGGLFVTGGYTLTNCIVSNNWVSASGGDERIREGGGVYSNVSDTTSTLINCTIAFNTNQGIRNNDNQIKILNSILFYNTPDVEQLSGLVAADYSDIQIPGVPPDSTYPGKDNINADPFFNTNDMHCLHIVEGSPCIDKGSPEDIYNDECFPEATGDSRKKPSLGTERNDIGAHGGPMACNWTLDECLIVSVREETINLPKYFILQQNYPNPFNPRTTISYQLPNQAKVELTVYNFLGQNIKELVNEIQAPGIHRVQWDGKDNSGRLVASSVYIYQIRANEIIESKKLVLIQ